MPKFSDSAGREWVIEFSVGAIKRVRTELGLDLSRLADNQFAGYMDAAGDPVRLSEVLYSMGRGQHPAVSLDEFQNTLSTDSYLAAAEAFQEAFLLFCPSHQREAIRSLVASQTEAEKAILKAITDQVAASWTTASGSAG